jgi:hypothetical protein
VTDTGSPAPTSSSPGQSRPERETTGVQRQLELPDAASELLAIFSYLIADDGPLQSASRPAFDPSPWHQPVLLKALERLQVIDAFLRGRVAFFVAGKDHGYYTSEREVELAGAALDSCRAMTSVVEALLEARLPTEWQLESMGDAAFKIHPALKAIEPVE